MYLYLMISWVQILIFPKHTYLLTHSFPIHSFSTPWKHQKTIRFSDVFRGEKKGALGTNGLTHLWPIFQFYTPSKHQKAPLVFWSFQGVSNGSIGHKWVNLLVPNAPFFIPSAAKTVEKPKLRSFLWNQYLLQFDGLAKSRLLFKSLWEMKIRQFFYRIVVTNTQFFHVSIF